MMLVIIGCLIDGCLLLDLRCCSIAVVTDLFLFEEGDLKLIAVHVA
jgi:hypothetical protein